MTRFYPMFLDVEGRTCLVVGGGPVAQERTRKLLEHGARVRLVSPAITPQLNDMVAQFEIAEFRNREYVTSDLEGCRLAVAATNSAAVNGAVRADARERNVLCNVADDPASGDFIVPALVRRGDLAIAVATGGASPVVSSHVRAVIEDAFGPEWGELLAILGGLREELKRRVPEPGARSSRMRDVLESDVLGLLARGESRAAEGRIRELLGMGGG